MGLAMSYMNLMIKVNLTMDCFSASPGKRDSAVARRPGKTLTYALVHHTRLLILTCVLACYTGSAMQASPTLCRCFMCVNAGKTIYSTQTTAHRVQQLLKD